MRQKYVKPNITAKKVKMSYFLTPLGFLDEFHLLGDVYAQTGGCAATGGGTRGTTRGASTGGCAGSAQGTNTGTTA